MVLHQAADLQPAFDAALPQLFKGAHFEATTIRGRRVHHGTFQNSRFANGGVVSTPGAELAWWAEGGHLVIAFGEPAVDAELDVADGKAPPITQTANLRKFCVEPTDFQAIAAGWCDVAALRKSYGDVTIQEKNATQPKFTVGQLIDVLGGGQLGLLAMRTGLKDRALVSEFTLDAPAPRSGVLRSPTRHRSRWPICLPCPRTTRASRSPVSIGAKPTTPFWARCESSRMP